MPFQSTLLRRAAGELTSGTHTHADQTRRYELYVPAAAADQALPLVIMLHGCSQSADDFATGSGMNQRARDDGFFALFPQQSRRANPTGCWNWFLPEHQRRGNGEPALLASLTLAVVQQYGIDPRRVFIAGMSAGGVMATLTAQAYPDLFAAVGVHSGLHTGSVSNMDEAMRVMNHGSPADDQALPQPTHKPIIVFHGDQDDMVHRSNGEQLVRSVLGDTPHQVQLEPGVSGNGRPYTRHIYADLHHKVLAEYWLVHGSGHAWSGGSPSGSYTDRHGPDATGEMLRFFFDLVS
ncbi:MAG: PHB depolymerase family esterase [Rhodoferax sp.]|nr:PHB depolymerase family esterase [Rhodoferax sp.]